MGKIDLSMNQVKSVPVLLGEVDLLKTLQLLPGVRNAGEGNTGMYVRGGGPDQNLILLDDAIVYNTGHLFGFFSVFNSDAIKNTSLIKGGMPAQYGGRLSSVLDVAMKEGNMKNLKWKAALAPSLHAFLYKDRSKRKSFIHRFGAPHLCGCFGKTICEKRKPVLRIGILFLRPQYESEL